MSVVAGGCEGKISNPAVDRCRRRRSARACAAVDRCLGTPSAAAVNHCRLAALLMAVVRRVVREWR
ncbi:hypothetical protein WN944_000974 [Citrus x changshan-huyou]|uniref:Uncharacterized protein n=1 Tax=Citrus x changshan-huyou TaxID=2935761 RepID=A0AAP0QQX7_9ROSI